ncbi:uncharacterized protein LOC132179285 isoform X2 [Corylus avellana]|uniref:uncharacterized protein LOC132179285 isoform X2 n=1 Tax=Corylus avellana TaxID=13451 RepID=UPI00286CFAEF|nr:uncharacterized protein LOC132179285 isoform X2 [Corylus avellana]
MQKLSLYSVLSPKKKPIVYLLRPPWEEGALAPSSSSFPFRPLPLPLLILLASFEAKPVSSEALPAFSKALSYTLVVFSSSNNCIAHSSTVNPPFIGGFQRRIGSLFGNFRFDFFKIRSIIFRKPSPYTRPSTVFLGVAASVCHQNRPHTTSTRRSVTNTRQRVDLTRRRVQFTRHPLREAYANSKEEDKGSCFGFSYVRDVPPKPLDPNDVDQQFEIFRKHWGFVAKSLSPDGFPPKFLRSKGWNVSTSTPRDFHLGDARGIDNALRDRLPDFNFPLSHKSCQPVVVGKWYSPFMFVREGLLPLKDQMRRSMYYEITLEQRWERMFACERDNESPGNGVAVDAVVQREVVSVAGREAADVNVVDGVMWFRSFSKKGEEMIAGLSLLVVGRMKWEQERVGWVGGEEKQVTLKRVEEFGGNGGWRNFGFYVLVERFVVKRMDGSLLLTYDFNHNQQSRGKWE